ncbi:MAG: hypothetical protein AVDCRST_MAG86-1395 [uncultured Truepera sp.]|uniref:Uncharacterized protein n=1 Tax=uncultured Truepera sp. TaxID=543023 RepID=A0A6J4V5J4_9DEIN|nr:MAG: hypothetical protein AVDCRST_MAG86-1395 [uncultured Truepera sp.]
MSHDHTAPNPHLKSLDRLVGTWNVSGPEIEGTTRYKWLEGGFLLVQHFDFIHSGRKVRGLEVIGKAGKLNWTPKPRATFQPQLQLGSKENTIKQRSNDLELHRHVSDVSYAIYAALSKHSTEGDLARERDIASSGSHDLDADTLVNAYVTRNVNGDLGVRRYTPVGDVG